MNNEITYIESGEYPLFIRITMQQLKFWLSLKSVLRNPDHNITKLVNLAEHHNVSYIKYYKSLEHKYRNADSCKKVLQNEFKAKTAEKIKADATKDGDSRLGTYLRINPNLTKPDYKNVLEFQRVSITRYRTGSHNLKTETGRRHPRIEREERVCKCNTEVQTLEHCLFRCPLLGDIRTKYGITNVEIGVYNSDFLNEMERILDLKC